MTSTQSRIAAIRRTNEERQRIENMARPVYKALVSDPRLGYSDLCSLTVGRVLAGAQTPCDEYAASVVVGWCQGYVDNKMQGI